MKNSGSQRNTSDKSIDPRARAVLLEAELTDPPDTRLARWLIILGLAAIAGAIVWAHNAPVHEVVSGQGRILPFDDRYVLQDKNGGRIDAVFVREGDHVEAGDALVRFDRSEERARVAQLQVREAALAAELARVRAVAEGASFESYLKNFAHGAVSSTQAAVFNVQVQAREAKLALLQADVDLSAAQNAEAKAAITHLSRRETIQAKRFSDFKRLSEESGIVSRRERDAAELSLIETRSALAAARTRVQTTELELQRAQNAISEFVVQEQRVSLELASDLETRLTDVQHEIQQRLQIATRDTLYAPVDARIQSLTVGWSDEVVAPGGAVASLVPTDQEFIAELIVPSDRIGSITIGHTVSIKVLTFDFTRFGAIDGRIIDVSPTADVSRDGVSTYRLRIRLEKQYVGEGAQSLGLRPGLTIVGDIILGERTVLSYLLKPLRVVKDRAMAES